MKNPIVPNATAHVSKNSSAFPPPLKAEQATFRRAVLLPPAAAASPYADKAAA